MMEWLQALQSMGVSEEVSGLAWEATQATEAARRELSLRGAVNQWKILQALQAEGLSEMHLGSTTGYGYNDAGRELLDRVYARVFKAPAALLRAQCVSGTHAITAGLFGNLLPGAEMVCVTGAPYDTLKSIIGHEAPVVGSLCEMGIGYRELALTEEGRIDIARFADFLSPQTSLVLLQRSRGYSWRPSCSVAELGRAIARLRELRPDLLIMVDNCYGELVETSEPTEVGADLVAGSLIKNLGGGVAPTGGYLVGSESSIERAAARLIAPSLGLEMGPSLGLNRAFLQGLFMAPLVVSQALEGSVWAAYFLEKLGYRVSPRWEEPRVDLILAVEVGSPQAQAAFCRGIQRGGPVDHQAIPEPYRQPGYQDPILMAGGTFVAGSSIELSADGPVRAPYICYLQGGLNFAQVQLGVVRAAQALAAL